MEIKKIRCAAPKSRSREGTCDKMRRSPYCHNHMHYATEEDLFKVIFEEIDDPLLVRAKCLGDVLDAIDSDVEIEKVL